MSRTALVIAIALVGAIGALMLVLNALSRDPFIDDPSLLGFDPAHAVSLRLEEDGRAPVEFTRERGEAWTMSPRVDGGATWPAASARVRAALRMLADAKPLDEATDGLDADSNSVGVTVGLRDDRTVRVRLSPLPLGGRALARLDDDARVIVDGALLDVLRVESALAWRDTSALPGVSGDASRVRIESGGGVVGLAKSLGVWSLREPAAGRANQAAVRSLLDAISRLSVVRFIDEPSAANDQPLDARWRIDVEHDVRTIDDAGEVAVRTVTRRLTIGGAADVEGNTAYASPDGGRSRMIVRVESLREVAPDPMAFVARTAVDTVADNVGMIFIARADGREEGYRSGLDGWSALKPDGSFADVPDEHVRELLGFLSQRIAQTVEFGTSESFRPRARLLLFGFTDDPLESVEFGEHPDHPGAPAVRSADAVRIYPGATFPTLLGE